MASSGTLGRVALVRIDVSEELRTSFIRVTRIGELGTTLAVTSVRRLLVTACVVPSSPILASSPILVTLMKEALCPPKRRFLQEPHGVTYQKAPFFRVTAVKTSNLTKFVFHRREKILDLPLSLVQSASVLNFRIQIYVTYSRNVQLILLFNPSSKRF
jgi:hypothetical protein